MSVKKILIVDDVHAVFKERMHAMAYHCDDQPACTRAEALDMIADYEGLVIRSKFRVDKPFIDAAVKLKFIARAGSGMDGIDHVYAESKNIFCLNAPEGNRDAVAEHAIGMLLALMNQLKKSDQEIRQGLWNREANRGWELAEKTIAIIGYGNTGQQLAKKLAGFGSKIIAYDKYQNHFNSDHAVKMTMQEVFKEADIVSLHIPLTAETRQLVDDHYLACFEKPIFLLNTARGEIVNTSALLRAIRTGKVLAAALDVLEVEQFPALAAMDWYDELMRTQQVLLSPHVAGWTFESYRKISEVLAQKLVIWINRQNQLR